MLQEHCPNVVMDFSNADFPQLGITHEGSQISVWDRELIGKLQPRDADKLSQIVAEMGVRSGRAQGLSGSITTLQRVFQRRQVLFIHCVCNGASTREKGTYDAVHATCVLDFYVCEPCQRQGVGKALFASVLHHLSTEPEALAYDRPSSKLLAFLAKHYVLVHGVKQPNNFVIFRGFFQGNKREGHRDSKQPLSGSLSMAIAPSAHTMASSTMPSPLNHSQYAGAAHIAPWGTTLVEPRLQRIPHAGDQNPADAATQCSTKRAVLCDGGDGCIRQFAVDQCMSDPASWLKQRTCQNPDAQVIDNVRSCGPKRLPSISSGAIRSNAAKAHSGGSMYVCDQAARAAETCADPELTAALNPNHSHSPGKISKAVPQSNLLCGFLFDDVAKIHADVRDQALDDFIDFDDDYGGELAPHDE